MMVTKQRCGDKMCHMLYLRLEYTRFLCVFFSLFFFSISPRYNRAGWLGVKHQLTYILVFSSHQDWTGCSSVGRVSAQVQLCGVAGVCLTESTFSAEISLVLYLETPCASTRISTAVCALTRSKCRNWNLAVAAFSPWTPTECFLRSGVVEIFGRCLWWNARVPGHCCHSPHSAPTEGNLSRALCRQKLNPLCYGSEYSLACCQISAFLVKDWHSPPPTMCTIFWFCRASCIQLVSQLSSGLTSDAYHGWWTRVWHVTECIFFCPDVTNGQLVKYCSVAKVMDSLQQTRAIRCVEIPSMSFITAVCAHYCV